MTNPLCKTQLQRILHEKISVLYPRSIRYSTYSWVPRQTYSAISTIHSIRQRNTKDSAARSFSNKRSILGKTCRVLCYLERYFKGACSLLNVQSQFITSTVLRLASTILPDPGLEFHNGIASVRSTTMNAIIFPV